jgi:hypothetical protein
LMLSNRGSGGAARNSDQSPTHTGDAQYQLKQ